MKKGWPFLGLAALMAWIAFASCNSSGCTDNQSSLPLAGFYNQDGQQIALDSLEITGIGAPGDSVLYGLADRLSEAYLPLRSQSDRVSYRFLFATAGVADTIHFGYHAFPYFASEECGAMYRYQLRSLSYTTHIIDSIGVVDSMITNSPVQQLKIFFRTTPAPL